MASVDAAKVRGGSPVAKHRPRPRCCVSSDTAPSGALMTIRVTTARRKRAAAAIAHDYTCWRQVLKLQRAALLGAPKGHAKRILLLGGRPLGAFYPRPYG